MSTESADTGGSQRPLRYRLAAAATSTAAAATAAAGVASANEAVAAFGASALLAALFLLGRALSPPRPAPVHLSEGDLIALVAAAAGDGAEPVLLRLLSTAPPRLLRASVASLGRVGSARCAAHLARLSKDAAADRSLRVAARRALRQLQQRLANDSSTGQLAVVACHGEHGLALRRPVAGALSPAVASTTSIASEEQRARRPASPTRTATAMSIGGAAGLAVVGTALAWGGLGALLGVLLASVGLVLLGLGRYLPPSRRPTPQAEPVIDVPLTSGPADAEIDRAFKEMFGADDD